MRASLGISLLVVPLIAACQNFEARDYRVPRANHSDAVKVAGVLRSVAAQTGLQKRAPTPYDSPVIALYKTRDVDLRAGFERGDLRISVKRYKWPPPAGFIRADQLVRSDLSREFGARFISDPPPQVTRTIRIE
jgi:hypothetical protein